MSLTLGNGPLSANPPSAANYRIDGPAHKLLATPFPRRVRGVFADRTVLDTDRGVLVHESNILPRLYVPEEDLDTALLTDTDLSTHCPFKGDASYRSITVGEGTAENAVWAYREPLPAAEWLRGYASVYWAALDHWYDEDEEVFGHLRDPFTRVDIRASSRKVVVRAGDQVLAESGRPLVLSENGLPNRYYLPREDVRLDLLSPTDTSTVCPYKGTASYVRTAEIEDVAWIYEQPFVECTAIAGKISFDPGKVTVEVV
ncbi:DUF427 domain-containing protein [Kutzneria viridogrisea]|uniref:Uncharacterized protein (DUF427 family) n=1 Tax=Kutzneria viridogrisea TaxID=47990 RepID=A0ABR6B848_9PSEU|nr:uncharacterized protein (DUF427 family) [Kutzneria viridogrisea]